MIVPSEKTEKTDEKPRSKRKRVKSSDKDIAVTEKEQALSNTDEDSLSSPKESKDPEIPQISLEEIPGVGPTTAQKLRAGNINDPHQLMKAKLSYLESLGVKRPLAKRIRASVKELFPELYHDFEEELSLEDIEGIGPTTAKALREKGLSLKILETTPIRELEEKYGLSATLAQKYQNYIRQYIRGEIFIDGLTVLRRQEVAPTFTFGAKSLDQLTALPDDNKGGIRLSETYEFFGAFRSGKSQICHQLCVTVQLPEELGGIGKKAVFVDTEGTFSPTRIKQIVERFQREYGWEKTYEDVLKDILYARAYTSDHQQAIAAKLFEVFNEHPNEFGVVVVDSISAHFRAEFAGRGTLAERQQILNYHLSILHRLADTFGVAIVVTNQVQANPAQFFGDPTQAVGGNIIGHWARTRVYLRKSKGEKRIARIFDSPVLPENETIFAITQDGVVDPDE